ncbi:MAG: hypothetical protein RIM84_25880 [Alphaproteobacteria bacterium]
MRVRVYLATTEGPVSIDRITREPAVQSAVCLRRTTRVLPISAAYDAFVRSPSGVIERDFGPFKSGAFRIDLSGPVDDGESWQLAFYVAHDLARLNRLADSDGAADQILLLTGRVDTDLGVGAVDHVPEKLRAAADHLQRWARDRKGVAICVPPDNIDEVRDQARPDGVALRAIARAGEATSMRALPREIDPARRKAWLIVGAVAGGVLALLLYAAWVSRLHLVLLRVMFGSDPEATVEAVPIEPRRPEMLSVAIYERRARLGQNCPAVLFGGETPRQVRLDFDDEGLGRGRFDSELCAIGVVVDAGYDHYAAAFVRPIFGGFTETGRPPVALDGRRALEGPVDWTISLPRRPQSLEYRIVAVAGAEPVDEELNWLLRQTNLDLAVAVLRARGAQLIDRRVRLDR